MFRLSYAAGAAVLISALMSGPAFSQNAQQQPSSQNAQQQPSSQNAQQQPSSRKDEMNQVVCETQEVLGSRIATQRICKTRAQWLEDRRADRMEIDRVQTQRGSCDGKGCH